MSPDGLPPIVGNSSAMRRARELIERYAPGALAILVVGGTGTGKELVARHIHARSARRGRFVAVNCGALPREMAEGLLYGYERGAFSGAVQRHRGHIECADRGTLFLDELLSLALDGQAKLLRALDTGEIQRLGDESERHIDVRFVGAVQDALEQQVSSGAFRRDLYQRLAGVVIELPPLVERMEDVVPLAEYFVEQRGQRLEPAATQELMSYAWPGNVRELRLAIERAGCSVEDPALPAAAVRSAIRIAALGARAEAHRSANALAPELAALVAVCQAHGWDTRSAATELGIARSTLYYRLKAAGISPRACRRAYSEFHWNSMEFQKRTLCPSC